VQCCNVVSVVQRGGQSSVTVEELFSIFNDFPPLTFIALRQKIKVPVEWITGLIGCAVYDTLSFLREYFISNFHQLPYYEMSESKIFLKWPNDIVYQYEENFKKICGVLCEASYSQQGHSHFLLGIGLNLFYKPQIDSASCFWNLLVREEKDNKNEKRKIHKWLANTTYRSVVISILIKKLSAEIDEYLFFPRSVEQLKHLILERSLPKGTLLSVNKQTSYGRFLGLTDEAALVLEGVAEPIFSSEVSIEKKETKIFTLDKHVQIENKNIEPVYLAIDLGNTRIHIGLQSDGITYANLNYEYLLNYNKTKIREYLSEILLKLSLKRQGEIFIIYCSVVEKEKTNKTIQAFKYFLNEFFPEICFVEHQLDEAQILSEAKILGDFETSRLGSDRALKFYFSYHHAVKHNINTLVFSFGTAFTCEGVKTTGELLENFVAPGLQMSFQALHDHTALLPLLKPDVKLFRVQESGGTWDQSVYLQRGVFLSAISTLFSTIKLHSPCIAYITGGNAEDIKRLLLQTFPQENITLQYKPQIEIENLLIFAKKN
ncbi:MAG: type III pantothenate kinase, partial [Silvanigrellaceae bacterium]|nr:type III pantothenate kinase [Silvanigrellaceae bacterium]